MTGRSRGSSSRCSVDRDCRPHAIPSAPPCFPHEPARRATGEARVSFHVMPQAAAASSTAAVKALSTAAPNPLWPGCGSPDKARPCGWRSPVTFTPTTSSPPASCYRVTGTRSTGAATNAAPSWPDTAGQASKKGRSPAALPPNGSSTEPKHGPSVTRTGSGPVDAMTTGEIPSTRGRRSTPAAHGPRANLRVPSGAETAGRSMCWTVGPPRVVARARAAMAVDPAAGVPRTWGSGLLGGGDGSAKFLIRRRLAGPGAGRAVASPLRRPLGMRIRGHPGRAR
jgi:hypothetical protein